MVRPWRREKNGQEGHEPPSPERVAGGHGPGVRNQTLEAADTKGFGPRRTNCQEGKGAGDGHPLHTGGKPLETGEPHGCHREKDPKGRIGSKSLEPRKTA